MQTEIQATQSARTQYRAAFKSMAAGGSWHLFQGCVGVILMRQEEGENRPILVADVQAKAEQTMVNALSIALRRAT
ncbi:hypothetical protein [Comamonas antarctica]|uniref:hypothetical protein n=1 Tax=Comamonas antarctica TaxID=2743470 RepID=UPI0028E42063|nr:hypothetical protein [Comamonas antarctica]